MSVYYGAEYERFYKKQEALRKEYSSLGMTDEQIEEILSFDKKEFLDGLVHKEHNQSLEAESENLENGSESTLMKRFMESLSVSMQPDQETAFWWIDQIEDEHCLKALKSLSLEDLQLIEMLVFQELPQKYIASFLGISQPAVNKRIKKLRKIFTNFHFWL